jgi:hypothetical protein
MEPLFHHHRVAVVFAGHVHAVERSFPVWAGQRDDCGTVFVTIGDGGNVEGHADSWLQPAPEWSAFRNGAHFGRGDILVVNSSHLRWEWWPNRKVLPQDIVWILNPLFVQPPAKFQEGPEIAAEPPSKIQEEGPEIAAEQDFGLSTLIFLSIGVVCFGGCFVGKQLFGRNKIVARAEIEDEEKESRTSKGTSGDYKKVATNDYMHDDVSNTSIDEEQAAAWKDLRQEARQKLDIESETNTSGTASMFDLGSCYMAASAMSVIEDQSILPIQGGYYG